MSTVYRDLPVTTVHKITAGLKCDGCGKVHAYDPPSPEQQRSAAAYALTPPTTDWNTLRSREGVAWDVCPGCWAVVKRFLGGGGT